MLASLTPLAHSLVLMSFMLSLHFSRHKPTMSLCLGGLFHCLVGPAQLEDSASGSVSFFTWQDRFRLTSILGAHSSTLGIASLLLAGTALSNGALDTWSCGGGNTRVLKFDATTLNFFVLSRYIIRAPLGSEGWISCRWCLQNISERLVHIGAFSFHLWVS